MNTQEAIQELQYAPLADRLQAIEMLLQSLKGEIIGNEAAQTVRKHFRVRTIDLGTDIQVDRDEIYVDRVF